MDAGELWTRWSIRVALTLYVLALIERSRSASGTYLARLAWTLGFLALLVHLFCAFHFYHHWSHEAAYQATARQTSEVIGLDWGGGIYANYAFAVIWAADVAWWWARPATYAKRPRIVEWTVQGFLFFIAFNATVVFGAGPIRWFGLAATLALAG